MRAIGDVTSTDNVTSHNNITSNHDVTSRNDVTSHNDVSVLLEQSERDWNAATSQSTNKYTKREHKISIRVSVIRG